MDHVGQQRIVQAKPVTAGAEMEQEAGEKMLGPEGGAGLQLQAAADGSPQVQQLKRIQDAANASPQVRQLRRQGEGMNQGTLQRKENKTGLPDDLKSGVESLSGMAMDDVRVHYNSAEPAGLGAHAYAQGSDIHVAPGQEQHLAHEAWHVVQQKQGRVQATTQLKGTGINDDSALEREADAMGAKAMQLKGAASGPLQLKAAASGPVQRFKQVGTDDYELEGGSETEHYFKTQSVDPQINKKKGKEYRLGHEVTRTDERQGLLVSDDDTLAINDTQEQAKEFYAAEGIVDSSNEVLEGLGSQVRLQESGELSLQHAGVSLKKVTPKRAVEDEEDSAREFSDLVSHICVEMASGIMGDRDHEAVFQTPGSEDETVLNIGYSGAKGDPMLNTLGAEVGKKGDTIDVEGTRTDMLTKARPELPGANYSKSARAARGRKKARRMGINEYARPEVGEGYATYSLAAVKGKHVDFYRTGKGREALQSIWGYHYAAVVAKSGDGKDTVTLENYNRTDDVQKLLLEIIERQVSSNAAKFEGIMNEVTPAKGDGIMDTKAKLARVLEVARGIDSSEAAAACQRIIGSYNAETSWFFKMQGSGKGQSFHEQQEASGGFVNPLTLRVRPRDKDRETRRSKIMFWINSIPAPDGRIGQDPAFAGMTEEIAAFTKGVEHAETIEEIEDLGAQAKEAGVTVALRRALAYIATTCASTGSNAMAEAMERFNAAATVPLKAALVHSEGGNAYGAIEDRIQGLSLFNVEDHMAYAMAQSHVMDAARYAESMGTYFAT